MRPSRRSPTAACALLLAVACAATFAGSLSVPFFFDDLGSIPDNPHVRRLWPLSEAMSAPDQATVAGRPLVALTLAINYALGGLHPAGYHLLNLALHVACAWLLFGTLRRLLATPRLAARFGARATPLALVAALLWAVHPLQSEAVVYVIQRTELLVGACLLGTLWTLVRARTGRRPRAWLAASVACCWAGMASKEIMVGAPLLALLLDAVFLAGVAGGPDAVARWTLRRGLRAAWRASPRAWLAMAASWGLLAVLLAGGPRSDSVGFHLGVGPWSSLLTQATILPHYLSLAFWPHPLAVSYDWPVVGSLADALSQALVVATLLGASAWALARRPAAGFLGAWFFVILAPTSSFVPIVTEMVAERRMYLPLASVVVGVVLAADAARARFVHGARRGAAARRGVRAAPTGRGAWVATLLAVALAGLPAAVTARRVDDYRTVESIWLDVVAKQPTNAYARFELGVEYKRQQRWEESLEQLLLSIRLQPRHFGARLALADTLLGMGDPAEAAAAYQVPLAMEPEDPVAHHNYALALAHLGRFDEAEVHLRRAVHLRPGYADAHSNLGVLRLRAGDAEEARRHAERALRLQPGHEKALATLAKMTPG